MTVGTLAVVGLGLIGGSVARGARERGLAETVVGCDRSAGVAAEALRRGFIDRVAETPENAARGADLVVLAVPVRAIASMAERVRRAALADCVVTDTGSTKASLAVAMDAVAPPAARFVGAHPIAGREDSGLDASQSDLFDGAPCVITPTPLSDPAAVARVESFWSGLGCRLHRLAPAEHDHLFALISHLPHVAAYALVRAVFHGAADPGLVRTFVGGGFRDFTRIAASDPDMWQDICIDNREEILRAVDLLAAELADLRASIATADGKALHDYFARSRGLRRSL